MSIGDALPVLNKGGDGDVEEVKIWREMRERDGDI
jgi:hypothetical protein